MKLFDGLTKLVLTKVGGMIVIGVTIISAACFLAFSVLAIFTTDNVKKTEDLTKLYLTELNKKLEEEKKAFETERAKTANDIKKLEADLQKYSNTIEGFRLGQYTAETIKDFHYFYQPWLKTPTDISWYVGFGGAMATSIPKNKKEKDLMEKEEKYYDDFRIHIPKPEDVDWREIMVLSNILDMKLSGHFYKSYDKSKKQNLTEEQKKDIEEMKKNYTAGAEYNAERVKDILAIYFKRLDYETSEVVRYSEEDYWKTSKIARFPVFAIKDKILWRKLKIHNVKIIPKRIEEVAEELGFSDEEKQLMYNSLSLDLSVKNKSEEFDEYINGVSTKLEYQTQIDKYGEMKKVATGKKGQGEDTGNNLNFQDIKVVTLDNPNKKAVSDSKIIDPFKTEEELNFLMSQNLFYNPFRNIEQGISYKKGNSEYDTNDKFEEPLKEKDNLKRKKILCVNLNNLKDVNKTQSYLLNSVLDYTDDYVDTTLDGASTEKERAIAEKIDEFITEIRNIKSESELQSQVNRFYTKYYKKILGYGQSGPNLASCDYNISLNLSQAEEYFYNKSENFLKMIGSYNGIGQPQTNFTVSKSEIKSNAGIDATQTEIEKIKLSLKRKDADIELKNIFVYETSIGIEPKRTSNNRDSIIDFDKTRSNIKTALFENKSYFVYSILEKELQDEGIAAVQQNGDTHDKTEDEMTCEDILFTGPESGSGVSEEEFQQSLNYVINMAVELKSETDEMYSTVKSVIDFVEECQGLKDSLESATSDRQKAEIILQFVNSDALALTQDQIKSLNAYLKMTDKQWEEYNKLYDSIKSGSLQEKYLDFLKEHEKQNDVFQAIMEVQNIADQIRNRYENAQKKEYWTKYGKDYWMKVNNSYQVLSETNWKKLENWEGGMTAAENFLDLLFLNADNLYFNTVDILLPEDYIGQGLTYEEAYEEYYKNLKLRNTQAGNIINSAAFQKSIDDYLTSVFGINYDKEKIDTLKNCIIGTAYTIYSPNPYDIQPDYNDPNFEQNYEDNYANFYASLSTREKWTMMKEASLMSRSTAAVKDAIQTSINWAKETFVTPFNKWVEATQTVEIQVTENYAKLKDALGTNGVGKDKIELITKINNSPENAKRLYQLCTQSKRVLKATKLILSYGYAKVKDASSQAITAIAGFWKDLMENPVNINGFNRDAFANNLSADAKYFKESFLKNPFDGIGKYITDELKSRYGVAQYQAAFSTIGSSIEGILKDPRDYNKVKALAAALTSIKDLKSFDEIKDLVEADLKMMENLVNGKLTAAQRKKLMKTVETQVKKYIVNKIFTGWCENRKVSIAYIQKLFSHGMNSQDYKELAVDFLSDPTQVQAVLKYVGFTEESTIQIAGDVNISILPLAAGVLDVYKFVKGDPAYTQNDLVNIANATATLKALRHRTVVSDENSPYNGETFFNHGSNNFALIQHIAKINNVKFGFSNIKELYESGELKPIDATTDDKQYVFQIGDIALAKHPETGNNDRIGIFSGEYKNGKPIWYYFDYPANSYNENYYSNSPVQATYLYRDTIPGVPEDIVEKEREKAQQSFYQEQIYSGKGKEIYESLKERINSEFNTWYIRVTESANINIKADSYEENISMKTYAERKELLNKFFDGRISVLTEFNEKKRKSCDNDVSEVNRLYGEIDALEQEKKEAVEKKNSKKVEELQKEIDKKKQEIIDISKNADTAFSLYYTSSYAIENLNKIKETLNKDERSVTVLAAIETSINSFYVDSVDYYEKKDYAVKIQTEDGNISNKEKNEKLWQITLEKVKPLMQQEGTWEEPDLTRFNYQTKEDYETQLQKGRLSKGVADFYLYFRFFEIKPSEDVRYRIRKLLSYPKVNEYVAKEITIARKYYDNLSAEDKAKVDNYPTLEKLEKDLEKIYQQAVRDIELKIGAIGEITLDKAIDLVVIRSSINILPKKYQEKIRNLKDFEEAEAKMTMLKISNTEIVLLRSKQGNYGEPIVFYELKLSFLRRRKDLFDEETV